MAQDWIENKLVSDVMEGLGDDKLPQNLMVIWGFPANSDREGYNRLFLSLNFNEYIEFPQEGLVHVEDAGGPDNPFSGAMVWLRGATPIEHVRAEPQETERDFLQGNIAGQYLGNVIGNVLANTNLAGRPGGTSLHICTGAGSMHCDMHETKG